MLNSDALDMGNNAVCAADPVSGVDQRGVARPQGTVCDIGAYELDGGEITIIKAADPRDGTNFIFETDIPFVGPPAFQRQWGGLGGAAGHFDSPFAIDVDAAGNVYVADTYNHRIQKFDNNGNFLRMWGWGVDSGASAFEVCTAASLPCQAGSPGADKGQFLLPLGIAVDAAGNVYVSDADNKRIQKFDNNGNFLHMWGWGVLDGSPALQICTAADPSCLAGSGGGGAGQFSFPAGVAVNAVGDVYVAERDNHRVQKFDSGGNFLLMWGWGVNTGATAYEICTAATLPCQAGILGVGDGQFDESFGVRIDPAGNVYVSDSTIMRIQKFTASGNFLLKWGTSGSGQGQFFFPFGVTSDAAGRLYVADAGNNRIQQFSGIGAFQTQWGSTGAAAGQFNNPDDVAVDGAGNVFVADGTNNRIQKFAPVDLVLDDALPDDGDGIPVSATAAVAGGVYTVAEILPPSWRLDQIFCLSAGPTETGLNFEAANGLEITMDYRDELFCTFHNGVPGFLTIVKEAEPADGTDFPFSLEGPGANVPVVAGAANRSAAGDQSVEAASVTNFVLDDAVPDDNDGISASETFTLPHGTYTVTEQIPALWSLTGVDCGQAGSTPLADGVQVVVPSGAEVTCTFSDLFLGRAGIKVNKDADPSEVYEPGGKVDFIFDVWNTGDRPAQVTDIDDTYFGDLDDECDLPQPIDPGQTFTCTITRFIGGDGGDVHFNRVTVTAVDDQQRQVKDTSDEDVDILDIPSLLTVKKEAAVSEVLEPGASVPFTVTARNDSPVDEIIIDSVSDDIFGDLTAECLPAGPVELDVGQAFECSFSRFVGGTTGDVHTNTITVAGEDDDDQPVSAQDEETVVVDNVASSILVSVSADPATVHEPGAPVAYSLTVRNSSAADDVTIESVSDSRAGDLAAACLPAGPVTLAPAETLECTFSRFAGGQAGHTVVNTTSASGVDDDGFPVADSDSAQVHVLDTPAHLVVTNSATPALLVSPGGQVEFTVLVLNDSPADAVTVTALRDTVYPNIDNDCQPALPATLQPGETMTCQLTVQVSGQPGGVYRSRVTAEAVDDDGYPLGGTAEVKVIVIEGKVYLPLVVR